MESPSEILDFLKIITTLVKFNVPLPQHGGVLNIKINTL
jgi:hypothetical protein